MIKTERKINYNKAGIFYLIGTVFNKGMAFFTVPIFTRILSTTDYGIVTTFNSWVSIIGMVIGFAMHMGIRVAFVDYKGKIDDFLSTTILFTAMISIFATSIVCGGIVLLKINLDLALVFMCMLQSFMSAVIQDYSMYLMMKYKYKFRTMLMVLPNLISVTLSTIIIVFVLKSDHYLGLIVPTVIVNLLFCLFILYKIFKKGKFVINNEYLLYGLGVSAPLILHGIALNILSQSDRSMITALASASQTGIYSLVYNFSMIATVITTAFEGVWVPWFIDQLSKRNIEKINELANDYINFMTYAIVGLILLGTEIFKLLADISYWEGIFIIPPLVLSNYIIFLYTLYVNVEHYYKKTMYITLNTVVAAVSNLILNYILIPLYGYSASAFATLFSYILSLLLHSYYARKLEPNVYPIKIFTRQMVHILVAVALFYILQDIYILRWGLTVLYTGYMFYRERKRVGKFFPKLSLKFSFFK